LAVIKSNTDALGQERIQRSAQKDWPELVSAIKTEESRGTDPSDQKVQELAQRWTILTKEFTGGDPAISARLLAMYEHDSEAFAKSKVGQKGDAAVADFARCVRYIAKALKIKYEQ
jgi:hypothetical protein